MQKDLTEIESVLSFWFGASGRPRADLWFSATREVDEDVRARFAALYERARRGACDAWRQQRAGSLALMILFDQVPRHLFRGTVRMFESDARASTIARQLADDGSLAPAERALVALALMHPEDTALTARSIALLDEVTHDPRARADRATYKRMLANARRHLRVLRRFCRDPQRNALLGRAARDDERGYLASDNRRNVRSVRPQGARLRILVLHGLRQSGARLKARCQKLERALEDIAELVYLDAPHPYTPDASERAMLEDDFGEVPDFAGQRAWWNSDDDGRVYHGWEASLRMLEQQLPVDGVLGFSQGSAAAGLLAALEPARLRFAICISGFASRADAHAMLTVPRSIDVPSIHVYGEQDVLVDRERTLALAELFVAPQVIAHPGGHFMPELWPHEAIRAFLLPFGVSQSATPRTAESLLAAWQHSPALVREALNDVHDFQALRRLALLAVAELPAADALLDLIAARFARGLAEDVPDTLRSLTALAAPRAGSGIDRRLDLARRIAVALHPELPLPQAERLYRRHVVALSALAHAARRRAQNGPRARSASDDALPSEVVRPRPVPVIPCPLAELDPLLAWLRSGEAPHAPQRFARGTIMPDGRLDLCKQVVGPDGIGPLLGSLSHHAHVERLLLGNNVIGSGGAARIADFVESGASRVRVWYLAGNEIDGRALALVCRAMTGRPEITGLWLKRNPLGPDGARPLAELLAHDTAIETLDLVNTGLLDDGAITLLEALTPATPLRHLYLGTNGLTARSAPAIARVIAELPRLESLYVDCSRLGDDGVLQLAEALRSNTSLVRLSLASSRIGPRGARALVDALALHPRLAFLNLGFTRATTAVREHGNHLGDAGAAIVAELVRESRVLRLLDVSHNGISQHGLDALTEAVAHNQTLIALRRPQYGKARNAVSAARLDALLQRNLLASGLDDRGVEAIRAPKQAHEVMSVYRTQSA